MTYECMFRVKEELGYLPSYLRALSKNTVWELQTFIELTRMLRSTAIREGVEGSRRNSPLETRFLISTHHAEDVMFVFAWFAFTQLSIVTVQGCHFSQLPLSCARLRFASLELQPGKENLRVLSNNCHSLVLLTSCQVLLWDGIHRSSWHSSHYQLSHEECATAT